MARLHGDPVGCGGLKLPAGAPAEIKRMWVDARPGASGSAAGCSTELEARAVRHGCGSYVAAGDEQGTLTRRSACTAPPASRRSRPFNDEPYAHHWFEKRIGR